MDKQYFFDYASCTPVDPRILKTYCGLLETAYLNSEAVYTQGLEIHNLVEKSRAKIAKLLQVLPEEIIFTSGASEANSFAIKGYALKNKNRGKHLITSLMEHSSVLNAFKQLETEFGFEVDYLKVNDDGQVTLDDIKAHLREDTILVSLMAVNNEIGSIQDINAIGCYLRNKRICFMSDGVQQVGKMSVDLTNLDLYTFTTHKLYGVKGCGILFKRKNIRLLPLIDGGQQEFGLRGGTINAPAVIVAAKTMRLAFEECKKHHLLVEELNTYLRQQLEDIPDVIINSPTNASPYIINFSVISIGSEIMMNALNSRRICVSAQSTCSSRTKAPSHTLKAMGKSDAISYGSIRVSLSHFNSKAEIDYLTTNLREIIDEYRT